MAEFEGSSAISAKAGLVYGCARATMIDWWVVVGSQENKIGKLRTLVNNVVGAHETHDGIYIRNDSISRWLGISGVLYFRRERHLH